MKKFIVSVLFAAVFFVGLGALVQKAGAHFKSDARALELVRKARVAIGGDSAIAAVRSLKIVGQTNRTIKVNGVDQSVAGETEIAMQLPDKLMKMVKIGHGDGAPGSEATIVKNLDVMVVGDEPNAKQMTVTVDDDGANGPNVKKIIIKKSDGTTEELTGAEAAKIGGDGSKIIIRKVDGGNAVFTTEEDKAIGGGDKNIVIRRVGGPEGGMAAHHDAMRHNEMLRLTLGLLMSAPEGMDVDYQYGGESDVDGTACNVVVASFGGSSFKIYLSKSTDLPVMLGYTGVKMPEMVQIRRTADPNAGQDKKEVVVFDRKIEGGTVVEGHRIETTEFNVKFSDYRSVGGVQLPYKWTQTAGGSADEVFDVTSYDVNPTDIADKFKGERVMVRTAKPTQK